jgi:hypothetical protein
LNLKLYAIQKARCEKNKIFVNKISGAKAQRLGLDKCLAEFSKEETLY